MDGKPPNSFSVCSVILFGLRGKHFVVLLALSLAIFDSEVLSSNELTPQQKRGQQIYLKGISPSGQEILAELGGGTTVPASAMPCANCHGADGLGRPEGGVTPSNITWQTLTRPYDAETNGRRHPPYTERTLKRALTMGVDPAGNALQTTMPRYRLSLADLDDLLAYLKLLGRNLEPGVTDSSLRIGVILPPARLAEMHNAVKTLLTAYFDDVNRNGGVFARRIEPRFVAALDSPEMTTKAVREFLAREHPFALTASFLSGADESLATLAAEQEIPLVGAFSNQPLQQSPPNRFVFYLLSGLNEQARALAVFAARQFADKTSRAALLHFDDRASTLAAESLLAEWQKTGLSNLERLAISASKFDAATIARQWKSRAELVFFIGSNAAQNELLTAAERVNWRPTLLAPSAQVGRELFDAPIVFDQSIFLAYPTLPSDLQASGVAEYRRLAETANLSAAARPAQITALASAKLLTETLRVLGRDVTREKLIGSLERVYGFKTGLTPAIGFNANRRIGALGAYIVAVDLKAKTLKPISGWIELE